MNHQMLQPISAHSQNIVIKTASNFKSANFACLAWWAAGIVVPPGILNTGSYDAGN